ncbi:MerR family DNA-binding transcriptional regulator [bacterium]|nr:MerR family DNA-binding transcriptional regulator [bacterium]
MSDSDPRDQFLLQDEPGILPDAVPISDAAERLSLSASTLRNYESIGLTVFPRDRRGYRWVSGAEIARIASLREYMDVNKLNLKSLVRLCALLPCWQIHDCSGEERNKCAFVNSAANPCWTHHRDAGGCLSQNCLECTIYKQPAFWIEETRAMYRNGS